MIKPLLTTSLIASVGLSNAATTFTEGTDKLWSNTDNWSSGALPTGGELTTVATGEAVVDVDDIAGMGNLVVNLGASLTVNQDRTLRANQARDATINGTMTVDGTYTVYGNGADLFIDGGVVNITSTGTLDARKSTHITNGGRLNLSSVSGGTWVPQDRFVIDNSSVLHFDVFNGNVSTVAGSSVFLDLGNTATLSLDATNTGVGTYDLITGIQDIRWATGGAVVNDREFGTETVTNLGAGLAWDIVYDHTGGQGAREISLVITAVPEPSTAALLGLGGLSLILRRRK